MTRSERVRVRIAERGAGYGIVGSPRLKRSNRFQGIRDADLAAEARTTRLDRPPFGGCRVGGSCQEWRGSSDTPGVCAAATHRSLGSARDVGAARSDVSLSRWLHPLAEVSRLTVKCPRPLVVAQMCVNPRKSNTSAAVAGPRAAFGGIATELQHPRLVVIQRQPELREPRPQGLEEPSASPACSKPTTLSSA